MLSLLRGTLLSILLLLVGCAPRSKFVPLFNGSDLSGWKNVNTAESTWTVRDGMIVCSGFPTGVMCTERHYENFILELEWRHVTEGGNAGLFIHSDPLPARGRPFTRSIECQVMDGNHGDVFAIHGATMVPDRPHPRGWMRSLPREERANPTGEWNHYRVESRDGEITLAVNGKVVSGGSDLKPRKGYICLESEGAEVHFRKLRIAELASTDPALDETANVDRGFVSLYNGIDLSGWIRTEFSDATFRPDDWVLRSEATDDRVSQAQIDATDDPASTAEIDGPEPRGRDHEIDATTAAHLWTESDFGDFILIADWRMDCEGDVADGRLGGIVVRGSPYAEVLFGCEAAVSSAVVEAADSSAVVEAAVPSANASTWGVIVDDGGSDRGWHRLEITVRGDILTADLNGRRVAGGQFPSGVPDRGPIGLANHGSFVELANLFVKELK